ncbi:ComEC/Rec2 family competence protein [uncultured Anaerovibrio sp.]|uniref:ComEC/Rec2 family competence protein n=1 Tax=uncultured Anaerovibrio sp. TaxID=361586 RepID=UPI0025FEDA62|nr:ComEC/Rec2 family competence protein [uncultured Anaerovibrio sp.]
MDVGQGDAALIITPNGRAFMIDTGGTRKGSYDIGARVDVPYLLHYGVRKLDFIMLTHAHDDHAKGVGGILGKIPVGTVLIGHEGLAEYQKAFGGSQLVVCAPLQEDTEMTVDGVKIQILYAPINGNLAGGMTGNEFSNVIKISYGMHSFLFTGDLTAEHEQRLVQQGKDLHSTVLKVGHHGSNTSSSEAFLQMVNPSWCVISVGYGNSFGHPHKEIEKRLKQYTSQYIYRTDRDGAVVFRTDGKRMRMETAGDH